MKYWFEAWSAGWSPLVVTVLEICPTCGCDTAGISFESTSWLGADDSDKPVESEKPPTQLIQRG